MQRTPLGQIGPEGLLFLSTGQQKVEIRLSHLPFSTSLYHSPLPHLDTMSPAVAVNPVRNVRISSFPYFFYSSFHHFDIVIYMLSGQDSLHWIWMIQEQKKYLGS